MHYSHLTTELTNYFDEQDTRVRQVRHCLDAQVLNVAAMGLEAAELRLNREIQGRSLHQVPQNLDNRGVYQKLSLPPSLTLPFNGSELLPPARIEGTLPDFTTVTVSPYDDLLPVPSRLSMDFLRQPIQVPTGIILSVNNLSSPQEFHPEALPLPGRVGFWLDSLDDYSGTVTVVVDGVLYPQIMGPDRSTTVTETLVLTQAGFAETRNIWSSITRIALYSLPSSATLTAYSLPLGWSRMLDPLRPYTHPDFRDVLFPRYWEFDDFRIRETYLSGRKSGYETITQILSPNKVTALAVEPNTYGLWVACGSQLHYLDRREPLPDRLDAAALSREPYYGVVVKFDPFKSRPDRTWLEITPEVYHGPLYAQHRWIVEMPDREQYLLSSSDGSLVAFNQYLGWQRGAPKTISFPILEDGTYVFTLQIQDGDGTIREDRCVWVQRPFDPKRSFDLSNFANEIQGIAFDHTQQLWIWADKVLIPLSIAYDGYLFDAQERALYFTDYYQTLKIWETSDAA